MEVQSLLKKLSNQKEGIVYMKPCLDITLYWSGSVFDRSDDILRLRYSQ